MNNHLIQNILLFSILVTNIQAADVSYLRLTVETPTEQLKDNGNVLGQLPDSVIDYDNHDLLEIPPMGTPYLTLVFPHPDWGTNAGNYASDFHPISNAVDAWKFSVLSDNTQRTINLYWSGNEDWINRSQLLDKDLNTIVMVKASAFYSFNMNGQKVRNFIWNLPAKHSLP